MYVKLMTKLLSLVIYPYIFSPLQLYRIKWWPSWTLCWGVKKLLSTHRCKEASEQLENIFGIIIQNSSAGLRKISDSSLV